MFFSVKTLALSTFIFVTTSSAPAKNFPTERSEKVPENDVSKALDLFLDLYYDKYVASSVDFKQANDDASDDGRRNAKTSNVYETMQGDQPANENSVDGLAAGNPGGKSSQDDVRDALRERARDHWLQILKENVLRQLNRSNVMTAPAESRLPPVNISLLFPNTPNETVPEEDMIANTIMSFYPSCTVPENAVPEFRNDDKLLNLFFNYTNDNARAKVATATLRLHRIPLENSNSTLKNINCNNNTSTEDEKLLRVSIFWYTRLIRNRRRVVMKKRLCDSKVIAENSHWVEFNVRPAIRFWAREANLGLAVQVEDQEGRTLRADKYFKGTTCLVGMPTYRPIPTVITDDTQSTERLYHLLGRNTTSSVPGDVLLLPTIDVCTLIFPENFPNIDNVHNLRMDSCNLKQMHEQTRKLLEKDQLERLATLPDLNGPRPHRHMRHQHNRFEETFGNVDTKLLLTSDQVLKLTNDLNLTKT